MTEPSVPSNPAVARFEPVRTVADLRTLDHSEIVEGYMSAERGDPEPGPNRGRAFWHGWRNRMIDMGEIPSDEASRHLAREYVATERRVTERTTPNTDAAQGKPLSEPR